MVCSLTFLSGCVASPYKTEADKLIDLTNLQVFTDDGEKSLLFLETVQGHRRFCLAPTPDSVATGSSGLALSAKENTNSESIGDKTALSSVDLGGRSPSVLITRELMFRACEFSMNYQLSKEEALTLYERTLKSVDSMTQSQTEAGAESTATITSSDDSS